MYWVATRQDQVIGQILVTYEWSDWRNGQMWWIQSVTYRRMLAARAYSKHFLDHVTHKARDHSVVELRLYAETTNRRAHSTYLNQGFTTGHYQVFEKPITEP